MEHTPLLNRLISYSRSDQYPFHMPGHKRNGGWFPNPFEIDITEIEGFDNLHHPEGILKESMEWAAGVYGADRTYYLVNGSSGGILSAVMGTVKRGGRILIGRNCHKSVYHGVMLGCMEVEYVYPQYIASLGIQGGILPEDVEKALEKNPDIQAVLVVSPTYDGIVSDVRGIADAVHRYGIPLIVDEAHGAHFPFGKRAGFPVTALECGADIVIQSLHKTLPSFTQTAVLHLREGKADRERIERYLQMFQSSSPSYVLMAGMESCIGRMAEDGGASMEAFAQRIRQVRAGLASLEHMRLVGRELCGSYGVQDVDESKIVVSVHGCVWIDRGGEEVSVDGAWLSQILREEFHLEMEMCGVDYVVAITTVCDTQEGLWRLVRALTEIDGRLMGGKAVCAAKEACRAANAGLIHVRSIHVKPIIEQKLSDAADADFDEMELPDCVGQVSAEFIYLYPPGIPIVAPGERMTEEIVAAVLGYRKLGLPVQGMADRDAWRLRVVKTAQDAEDADRREDG